MNMQVLTFKKPNSKPSFNCSVLLDQESRDEYRSQINHQIHEMKINVNDDPKCVYE